MTEGILYYLNLNLSMYLNLYNFTSKTKLYVTIANNGFQSLLIFFSQSAPSYMLYGA